MGIMTTVQPELVGWERDADGRFVSVLVWVGAVIATGIAFALLAGFIHILQGAHFLSDVIFAGVTMALTGIAIYLAFQTIARARAPRDGKNLQDPLTGQRLW